MDAVRRRIVGTGTSESTWLKWLSKHPLSEGTAGDLVGVGHTVHILSPHPDDEVLACGGLMQQISRLNLSIRVWAITDGEASHPRSSDYRPAQLASMRTRESESALTRLAVRAERVRLFIPDGSVARYEAEIVRALTSSLLAGDTVIAPWRLDGHPDHEAVGRAGLQASTVCGCTHLEVPIWGWHWVDPERGEFPLHRAVVIPLSRRDRELKARAIKEFRSPLEPDVVMGAEPVLPGYALVRFRRPFEVVLR